MGRQWARAVWRQPDLSLAGVVDASPETIALSLAELKRETGGSSEPPRCWPELDMALNEETFDFTIDAAVPSTHTEVTIACLEAGLLVLGEKPMATSLKDARAMVAAADRTGLLFSVSQSRRYNAQVRALKEAAERLGEIGMVVCSFGRGPRFGGFREQMASPLLLDMAIHSFDLARWLVDDDQVEVYCEEYNPSWSWYEGAASAVAVFRFSWGARFFYSGSLASIGLESAWDGEWKIFANGGSARWDGTSHPEIEMGDTRQRLVPDCRQMPSGIYGALREFVQALDGGPKPMGDCHDNIKSLAMVLSAIESASRGTGVSVDM
jgi:predicted dehydrogenase